MSELAPEASGHWRQNFVYKLTMETVGLAAVAGVGWLAGHSWQAPAQALTDEIGVALSQSSYEDVPNCFSGAAVRFNEPTSQVWNAEQGFDSCEEFGGSVLSVHTLTPGEAALITASEAVFAFSTLRALAVGFQAYHRRHV